MSQELARLMADAKDTLEAEKFTNGSGEDEPEGIVTGASEVVETKTKEKFEIGDAYSLQESLPPRCQRGATFLASNAISNVIYRFVASGNTEEPPLMDSDRSAILGKPYAEVSGMLTAVTKGKVVLLYGDVARGFKVIDRLGASVELIPRLFGEEGFPKGERGLWFHRRTSSAVIVPNAIRALEVKPE